MLYILLIISFYLTTIRCQQPPASLPWYPWVEALMFKHLINMTAALVKDTTYKLQHAEKVKDKHSKSITYELGFIAAGIQERFLRMLKIYRKYANLNDFRDAKYTIPELMNAYHIIQGDYNEIRLEKGLFYEIVQKHESTMGTTPKYMLPPGHREMSSPSLHNRPVGRMGKTWRPRPDLNK